MKKLYIVRHAKSSWDYPHLSDAERPLNKRGKRDAPKMAAYVHDNIQMPDVFISSPAVRAFKTATKFAEEFGLSKNHILLEDNLYHASSSAWYREVSVIAHSNESAMLFGHNPGLTDFVNRICGESIYNIPTCGIASINLEIERWNEVYDTSGRLEFYYYPKGI